MEILMIIISLIISIFIFFILKNGDRKKVPLPPGPPKLPFIGNLHHLAGPSPHRTLHNLSRKYGPIMQLKLGFVPTVIVSSAAAASEIMKTRDSIFSNRPRLMSPTILVYNNTDIAFTPYGSYWRQLKKICMVELLTNKSLEATRFIREEEVAKLVRSIATSSEAVNVSERIFALSHNIVTRMSFGEKFEEEMRFRDAFKEGTMLASGFHIGDYFPSLDFVGRITGMKSRLEMIHAELDYLMDKNIRQHIERRKVEKPQRDREVLVDILLRLKDSGELGIPLSLDNIKSVLLDVIIGISDNSPNIVEWAMAEMIKHPRILEKAQAEVRQVVGEKGKKMVEESDVPKLSYLKMVVKETLRFHPPVPLLIPRESMERCTINGYEIPAKTRVFVNYFAISRDPLSWKDPDVFDPERFRNEAKDYKGQDFDFIPFGAGRRICPGIPLGMASTELSIASLLYHFDWKLPNGEKPEDLDMNETYGMGCYKRDSLCIIPTLRFPIPA